MRNVITNPRRLRQIVRLIADQGGICSLCGRPIHSSEATFDHIVPKSLGGSDSLDNLTAAHSWCNEIRGNSIEGIEIDPDSPDAKRMQARALRRLTNRLLAEETRRPETQWKIERILSVLRLHPEGMSEQMLAIEADMTLDAVHKSLRTLESDRRVRREMPDDPVQRCDILLWRVFLIDDSTEEDSEPEWAKLIEESWGKQSV